MSNTPPLRALAPRPRTNNNPSRSVGPSNLSRSGPLLPARRSQALAACDACHKRKSKCTAERPTCGACAKNNTLCVYRTLPGEAPAQALKRKLNELQNSSSPHRELLGLMKSMPDADALDVLRRLRSGSSPESILNTFSDANLLLQVALVPESRFRYDYPYGLRIPPSLVFANNAYLDSLLYEAASVHFPVSEQTPSTEPSTDGQSVSPSPRTTSMGRLGSSEYRNVYLKPFRAAVLVEPRLDSIKPSLWTSVSSDDALMRNLLKLYFLYEYQCFVFFHKDLFLEDMANQKKNFCSSLLVNVLLAYACCCYKEFLNRAEYWNPRNLMYQFLAEARRLWELEMGTAHLTTIHADMIIGVMHNFCGLDKIGRKYGSHAVKLANELRLFDADFEVQDERERHGRQFTAWALFEMESLVSHHFKVVPELQKPPPTPLPDPASNSSWYSEVWVKYPLNHSLSRTYVDLVFQAMGNLRVITTDMNCVAFGKDGVISFDRAIEFHSRLRKWYDDLPEPLQSKSIVLPSHLALHMDYQYQIINLFTPFLEDECDIQPSPKKIVDDASKQMQTLAHLYYLRHGFGEINVYLIFPLTYIGLMCVRSITEEMSASDLEDARSTLFLVVKGLCDQSRNYYLASVVYGALRKQMRADEVRNVPAVADLSTVYDSKGRPLMADLKIDWMKKQFQVDIDGDS